MNLYKFINLIKETGNIKDKSHSVCSNTYKNLGYIRGSELYNISFNLEKLLYKYTLANI